MILFVEYKLILKTFKGVLYLSHYYWAWSKKALSLHLYSCDPGFSSFFIFSFFLFSLPANLKCFLVFRSSEPDPVW